MASSSELTCAATARELLREKLFSPHHSRQKNTGLERDDQAIWPESRRTAYRTIHDLLQRTILHGEGNSLLIIGPRGCGKSWVLDEVMSSLESDKRCQQNFIKVELNGLVHTDDRLALLSIAKQLDVEKELEGKIAHYPVSQCSSSNQESRERIKQLLKLTTLTLSFSGALEYVLEALRSGTRANQSIVFLLDEFDLFTHHKNQTLLYNLFDATQSADNPIAVIGLSCRLDAVELLEKRVKSRFSHRQVTMFSDFKFEEYVALFTSLLSLPPNFYDKAYLRKWNEQLKKLSQNKAVLQVLKRRCNTEPNTRSLVTLLSVPVCRLGVRNAFLMASDFTYSHRLLTMESVAAILRGVSILELCLIVAMKHIVELNGDDPFNFETVYSEYKKFTQRSSSVEFFKKSVALKAFEHLVALELVCPAESGGVANSVTHHQSGKVMKEYQPMVLMLAGEQVKRAVQSYPNCPTEIARWGTSSAMAS